MNSEFNSMEDLAFSRSFRNWVLNQGPGDKAFWENWVARNPGKAEMVRQAKAFIAALHRDRETPREEDVDEEVRKALVRLRDAPRYLPADGPDRGRLRGRIHYSMFVVSTLLFLATGTAAYLFFKTHVHRNVLRAYLGAHGKEGLKATAGEEVRTIRLPDGSLVRLGRKSVLYYSPDWRDSRNSREVFLQGDAYFEVRKDAAAPFYIYSGQLVTRVLGTSLIVHDIPGNPRAAVTVVTGKVSVYRADDFFDHSPGIEPGVVLTRNQEALEDSREDRLEKTVAAMPELLPDQPDTALVFYNVSVRQALSRLEDLYGIPIQLDQAADSCLFTARLNGRSFYQELDMICQAIGGSYVVTDGSILVTARGCKQ